MTFECLNGLASSYLSDLVTRYIPRRNLRSANTAARLAQLGERRSAGREAVGSNPGRTNTQGL